MKRGIRFLVFGLGLVMLMNSAASSERNPQGKPENKLDKGTVPYRNTVPGVAYVGSKSCSGCHQEIYDQYIRTDMGRSMSLPTESSQLAKVEVPVTIFSKSLNRYFQVFRDGTNIYQSEYELDANGREVFRNAHKIEYVIGSGANGHSYIVRRGDYLFQAPLSYYSKPKLWDLSPGYELEDQGFNRPIVAACIVCHSGLPQPASQRSSRYRDPPFLELAVGCENCHGPGELHIAERVKGIAVAEVDPSIVNPADLPAWLADNICMNCHQGGDTRILQPGKDYLDFRPGTPLDNTVGIFRMPFKRESPPDSDLLEHYSSMILSRCYRQSSGQLGCQICHEPHFQPSPQEAPVYFRKKCLICHTEKSCRLSLEERVSLDPRDPCSGCHMPKREIKLIAHSSLTNHRIIARQGEPYPETAFRQTPSVLPDLVHVSAIPGKKGTEIPPLTLLQVYGTLMTSRPAYRDRYLAILDHLAKTEPNHPRVLSALARKFLLQGTGEATHQALQCLSRAIESGSASITDYKDLSELLASTGRVPEAIELLKRAIAIDPFSSVLYKSLALRYISAKKYPEALETMKQELGLCPEDSFMRKLISQAETAKPAP